MTFGEYLRQLREEKGLRQVDLAETIGVTSVYICDIEKGKRNPPDFPKLRLLVGRLDLPPDKTAHLYDLAGTARGEIAPDIFEYLNANPAAKAALRRVMVQSIEYDWTTLLRE